MSMPATVGPALRAESSLRRAEPGERLALEADAHPVVDRPAAVRDVEVDRARVPREDGEVEPDVAALHRELRDALEERLADTAAAGVLADEEVLQVERTPRPRRVRLVEEREAHRAVVDLGEQALERWRRLRQVGAERLGRREDGVRLALVLRQQADELVDRLRVVRRRRTDHARGSCPAAFAVSTAFTA